MGSPCELIAETESAGVAEELAGLVANEAWRIEDKFSRYIPGNIIDQINSGDGQGVQVDEETAQLIDFACTLYVLSDAAFDITSGVLRRAWTFDGSDTVPGREQVLQLLDLVGWDKAAWESPVLTLRAGMEIDLGGIGKEYAVDRAVLSLRSQTSTPCLVNFGGDLAATEPPLQRKTWTIGIEPENANQPPKVIELREGALATSGDARRFVEKGGVRYSHVLDPRSGWPVVGAATSITVAAATCTQAGMLATLALLKGVDAERFLDGQVEKYWCRR